MGITSLAKNVQLTRDEIGGSPEILPIPLVFSEKVKIFEIPVVVQTRSIGSAYIVGDQGPNGIFGASGTSNFIGTAYLGSLSTSWVVCANNRFIEPFRSTTFKGTPTTADFDTTNHWVLFDSGEVYETPPIFLNNQSIYKSTVIVNNDNVTGTANLAYSLTANGGTSWHTVSNGVEYTFPSTARGTDLRLRVTCAGGGATAKIAADNTSDGKTTPLIVEYVVG